MLLFKPLLHGAAGPWNEVIFVAAGVVILIIVWLLEANKTERKLDSEESSPPNS